jgi:membrane-associated PAP2 superfamily phosphatase
MRRRAPGADAGRMRPVRHAAAGIVALAAAALAASAVVAIAVGGLLWIGCVYALTAALLLGFARRIRPPRHRFVFARR